MGPSAQHGYGHEQDRLQRLQQRVTRLEMENLELRRQLDELRRGVGISVVIQGHAVPLAPAPLAPTPLAVQSAPHPAAYPSDPWTSQQPAASSPSPMSFAAPVASQSYGFAPAPLSQPTPRAAAPAPHPAGYPTPPQPAPYAAPRSGPLPGGPHSVPFSESSWLTGSMPAVQAPQPAASRQPRPDSPSQQMTPTWLREAMPETNESRRGAPAGARLRASRGAAAQSEQPSYTRESPAPAAVSSRRAAQPSLPHQETLPLSSLAELTGQHRAVRPQRRPADRDRNHYSDSFLLG